MKYVALLVEFVALPVQLVFVIIALLGAFPMIGIEAFVDTMARRFNPGHGPPWTVTRLLRRLGDEESERDKNWKDGGG